MCQEIVFRGQSKGKDQVQDNSDSGESEINWQLEALRLSDNNSESDEDDAYKPGFDSIPVYHDDFNDFNDGTVEENNVAGPSSVPQPTQSSLLMPATPQRASTTHPKPQPRLAQPPKQQSRKKKASHSSTAPSHDDALLTLPPPATPTKSTLSIASDSDYNPFEAPKKARARKGKQRLIIDSDEESIVVAQYSKHSEPPIAALNVLLVPPTDDDEERGKL
jgi:hypothetical protein